MKTLTVYIPRSGALSTLFLAPGSALVADPEKEYLPGQIVCYYEGNIHGAVNLRTFADKALCAAGRLAKKYPTSALAAFPVEDLVEVGSASFAPDCWPKIEVVITRPDLVAQWDKETGGSVYEGLCHHAS